MTNPDPLWLAIPNTDPLSATAHGEHRVEFVSRHAIAETGLLCPVCRTEVAPVGEYTMVRHSRLGDVIKCNGKRILQDEEMPCGMFLIASPDTEHGDHLLWDKVPKEERHALFHSFVRISEGDAVRLKYGQDVVTDAEGNLTTQAKGPAEKEKDKTRLPFKPEQVWQCSDGRFIRLTRVQTDGDPIGDGWAWGIFQDTVGPEWNISPAGLVKFSMSDPTMNDTVRLTHEVRSN
jgi:hypothetical protein